MAYRVRRQGGCSTNPTAVAAVAAAALLLVMLVCEAPHTAAAAAAAQSSRGAAVGVDSDGSVAAAAASSHATPRLSLDTISERVVAAEYSVRGRVVQRATELAARVAHENALRELGEVPESGFLPFDDIVYCNIGNPQSLGQPPLTFARQVLSLMLNPPLLEMVEDSIAKARTASDTVEAAVADVAGDGAVPLASAFHADAVERAREYVDAIPAGSLGAYSTSQGFDAVRGEVAAFIEARDGFAANADDIILTDGASKAAQMFLEAILRGPGDGVMLPYPQYPLYSATMSLLNATTVPYFLDESSGWALSEAELDRAVAEARAGGTVVRAIVVINPGNPTGQALPEESVRSVLRLAARENLVVIADEVYQENVWVPTKRFVSFKQVLRTMEAEAEAEAGPDGASAGVESSGTFPIGTVALVSLHSASKGFLGECGLRGGYMELVNVPREVRDVVVKLASIALCANTVGQIAVGLMVNPPSPGSPSHELYAAERDGVLDSLRARAALVTRALNRLDGVSCNEVEGALYAFPTLTLPQAAVAAAHADGIAPDLFYCLNLLEETGIVVVPGSGFGQVEGTFHFRTTILPPADRLDGVVTRLANFHQGFMDRWRAVSGTSGAAGDDDELAAT